VIGTDVIVKKDVSDVFRQDFDVASSVYPDYTRDDGCYCGDVVFCKQSSKQFWIEVLEKYRSFPKRDGWEWGQVAFREVANSGKHKVMNLDFDTYCFTPEAEDESTDNAFIVHYRGPTRKPWMKL
jgi:hypothetical protein